MRITVNPEGTRTFANWNPLRSPGFVLAAADSHSVDLNEAEIAQIVISPFIVSYPWQAPISTSVLANMIQEDEKQTAHQQNWQIDCEEDHKCR